MHGETLRVEAETAVQAAVVEQQHAGLRLAAHLDLDLELVAESPTMKESGEASRGCVPLPA